MDEQEMEEYFPDEVYDFYESLDDKTKEALVMDALRKAAVRFSREDDEDPEGSWECLRRQMKLRELEEKLMGNAKESYLRGIANRESPFSEQEIRQLASFAGKDESGFSPLDYEDDDEGVTDEMLEGYAKHLRNYLYTYKDEAKEVDPSIDPSEEHKGPMAQDIEQVAPDCVKETPEGVKTVDGGRLSLVNAGVIGELARRVMELEEKINAANS